MTVKLNAIGRRSIRIRSVGEGMRAQNATSNDGRDSCWLRKELVEDAEPSKVALATICSEEEIFPPG